MEEIFYVYTDGGAKGNPGPGGIGFIVKDSKGKTIIKKGKFIGYTTNNKAEYIAVLEALKWLKENFSKREKFKVKFFLDSQLVVNQLNGNFKIKNENLKLLQKKIKELEKNISFSISYNFINRKKNKAHFLVPSEPAPDSAL
ncbi:MAG: ribonuclease HI family protein [Microgenomates group bacterium]